MPEVGRLMQAVGRLLQAVGRLMQRGIAASHAAWDCGKMTVELTNEAVGRLMRRLMQCGIAVK